MIMHTLVIGIFQSTLPVRGATVSVNVNKLSTPHFNPRSPCGERLCHNDYQMLEYKISIHAPRAGSDSGHLVRICLIALISIHAPRAGSDFYAPLQTPKVIISIHAPRAGSDRIYRKDVP